MLQYELGMLPNPPRSAHRCRGSSCAPSPFANDTQNIRPATRAITIKKARTNFMMVCLLVRREARLED
uniref:Orf-25 protein n=1 Tax=Lymantria dispar multicapsid nuclear polyhedrosis virus TaxID=10449 RepID=A0A140IKT6_NPVLD|nr:Orf-25 protein [Lymantria dispar multiple nucleopolyhedrovirus]